jgi:AraC-like DNA-binding protein
LAESVGVSTPYFAQMFRKSTGESPHQFVLRHRIERGKEMLRQGEARVLDVAIACGFKTQQHFAGIPKDVRNQPDGISPEVYALREGIELFRTDGLMITGAMRTSRLSSRDSVNVAI